MNATYIAQVVSDDEVAEELFGEFRVHLKHIEEIIAVNLVQVAVSDGAHVTARLADRLLFTDVLTEHVVLPCCTRRQHDFTIIPSCSQRNKKMRAVRPHTR